MVREADSCADKGVFRVISAALWKEKIARNFDLRADAYNEHSFVQNRVARNLANDLPAFPRLPSILEIGCGGGAFTQYLLNAYKDGSFHITDISPQMLARARSCFPSAGNLEWSVMDGENPPSNRTYDLIAGNMVFQWFEDIEGAVDRLAGLLNPGGSIIYSLPAPDSFPQWRQSLSALSLPSGLLDFARPPGIFREEEMEVSYESGLAFLQALKKMGAHTPRKDYIKMSRVDLIKACRLLDERFRARITWRILYGRLEAPKGGSQ